MKPANPWRQRKRPLGRCFKSRILLKAMWMWLLQMQSHKKLGVKRCLFCKSKLKSRVSHLSAD